MEETNAGIGLALGAGVAAGIGWRTMIGFLDNKYQVMDNTTIEIAFKLAQKDIFQKTGQAELFVSEEKKFDFIRGLDRQYLMDAAGLLAGRYAQGFAYTKTNEYKMIQAEIKKTRQSRYPKLLKPLLRVL